MERACVPVFSLFFFSFPSSSSSFSTARNLDVDNVDIRMFNQGLE